MDDGIFRRAPSLWTSKTRESLPAPTPLNRALANYAKVVELPNKHGRDPLREMVRERALARGVVSISSIAATDAALPYGSIGTDPRRRRWRFRALDPASSRCVFERIVLSETPEGAKHEGQQLIEREFRKLGLGPIPDGLLGTVMAV